MERDFVEAPSQMLENWVWNKESLKLLSSHYKDASSIDEKLLDDLIRTKNAANGCFNMRHDSAFFFTFKKHVLSKFRILFITFSFRQILFAKMDQHFHTNDKVKNRA